MNLYKKLKSKTVPHKFYFYWGFSTFIEKFDIKKKKLNGLNLIPGFSDLKQELEDKFMEHDLKIEYWLGKHKKLHYIEYFNVPDLLYPWLEKIVLSYHQSLVINEFEFVNYLSD